MSQLNKVEVTLVKIIPAPKWKVIRMVTRIWEYPSFVANVREATVLEKKRNKLKTKWKIEINKLPISWIEEDSLELINDSIYFDAIEGDLDEFRGKWFFETCDEGTKVTVNVTMRVGIPIIQDFAEDYIRKILTRNFEAILDAFERKIISVRYQSFKKGDSGKVSGFGIIGHPYNFNHWEKYLLKLRPDIKLPSREFLGHLFNITPSFKLYDILNFHSPTGISVNGCFIVATFIPDMVDKDIWSIFSKVVRACRVAEKYGVGIVSLGGFTSIVAERVGEDMANEVDVAVTTGNSFTAAMAIEGVIKSAYLLDFDISRAKAAIIGGTGDIGSGCARVLARRVKQLTITGRTKANLKKLKVELDKNRKARIEATTDNKAAVSDADIIIAVASATSAILDINWFKPGAIICDVGYPKNISYTPTTRTDILVFSGGLAKPPSPFPISMEIGLPAPDALYGCFSESIILAMEKRFENFSFGRGNITVAKIEEIRELGKKHGFSVSDFYWGDRLIDDTIVRSVKAARRETTPD